MDLTGLTVLFNKDNLNASIRHLLTVTNLVHHDGQMPDIAYATITPDVGTVYGPLTLARLSVDILSQPDSTHTYT
jgi:hypothetical protein